jgi:plasmid replication initiation protein
MFALSKIPDLRERRYEHNGNSITITPSVKGLATIWDKDIVIYAVSQLVAAMNAGRQDLSPTIRLRAYDLLVNTNLHTGGGDYDQLKKPSSGWSVRASPLTFARMEFVSARDSALSTPGRSSKNTRQTTAW